MAAPSPSELTRQQLDELDALLQRMLSLPLSQPEPESTPLEPLPPLPPLPSSKSSHRFPFDSISFTEKPPQNLPASSSQTSQDSLGANSTTASSPNLQLLTPHFHQASAESDPAVSVLPNTKSLDDPAIAPTQSQQHSTHEEPFESEQADEPITLSAAGRLETLRGVDAPALPAGFQSLLESIDEDHTAHGEETLNQQTPFPHESPFSGFQPLPVKEKILSVSDAVPTMLWPMYALNALTEWLLSWAGPLGGLLTTTVMKYLLGMTGIILLVSSAWWIAQSKGWLTWLE